MVKKEVKTNKELFEQKYPIEELAKKPIMCIEAVGYLRAIIEYLPSERIWAEPQISAITLVLVLMWEK